MTMRSDSVDTPTSGADAVVDLEAATCSNGAPSARNLLVTVFGDVALAAGPDAELGVQQLGDLLVGFGVNERLVRTSLSRLVNDGLLAVRSAGRRSFYRVAPESIDLFRNADDRIYRGRSEPWDGSWTLVVLDGGESTARRRARLRQELAWAGFGTVAPNVMASPVVPASSAADAVARVGGFDNVLVSRSAVVDGPGLLGVEELARRCAELDDVTERYGAFVDRFGAFDDAAVAGLSDAAATKLRILLVAAFRRIALADPHLPSSLLPHDWVGGAARMVAARIYRAVAPAADRHLRAITGLDLRTPPARFG